MGHWKALFDYKHLGCQDLPPDPNNPGKFLDMIISIKSLEKREIIVDGGRRDTVPVAELHGNFKPMIMNKTNLRKLEELFDSTDTKDFLNKPFSIYAARVEGKAKKIVDGLRIRDDKPVIKGKVKVELTPESPKWDGARKALKEGNTSIEAIKGTYLLTPENEAKLTA